MCKIGEKCSTSSNTFEDVASFATDAINQQALFEVRPYQLVGVLEASVNYYWQATLHYELQMHLVAEKELALCIATVIDQMGSKSPHLIKSKCMSVPPTNRSIDSQLITPSTSSTAVIAMPTEPMQVTSNKAQLISTIIRKLIHLFYFFFIFLAESPTSTSTATPTTVTTTIPSSTDKGKIQE